MPMDRKRGNGKDETQGGICVAGEWGGWGVAALREGIRETGEKINTGGE